MLDFSIAKDPVFDVKLKNGVQISIPVITMKQAKEMELMTGNTEIDVDKIFDMTLKLLNTNMQNISFQEREVEKMFGFPQILQLFHAYTEWLQTVLQSPNFNCPTTRKKRGKGGNMNYSH